MAEAVVQFVIQTLRDLLVREALLLHGVRDEVNWLQRELTRMQCFLKDADQKQDTDNRVRCWVSEIRNVAYDTEDVVDTFILETACKRRGFAASVKKCACIINHGVDLHGIGGKIQDLKKRILDISRSREIYGIKSIDNIREGSSSNQRLTQLRRTSSYASKEQVVGFEDDLKILVNQLLKEEQQRCVISIVGMGGLGKTTLARKLYNSSDLKGKFDCCAWICVSQEYTTRDLLQRIIKCFEKPTKGSLELMEKKTEEDLECYLYEFLGGKQYLVVIDDVWCKEAWESLRRAFPDNGNGSRVILTTRNKAVAMIADEKTFVHELRFLKPEESWELFYTKAFPDPTDGEASPCSPRLEELGREMVEKCGGLPLAIIVLGGLMSRKQPHEWHKVKDHIWRHLTKDSIQVELILALSYNELPYQLKSCFLYLSLFPEDFVINTEKLIRLWIAEGFIPQGEGVLEDVAEEYLKELIDRSMIQIAKRYLERIQACRVHDLLRDLAVQKAKEVRFLDIYGGNLNSSPSASCRRQAIHSGNSRYVSLDHSNPHLRSLLFFNPDHESLKIDQLKFIYLRFRLLRMLDLEDTRIEPSSLTGNVVRLPDAIGKLIHLRYLVLKSSEIVEFPSSIGNLRSLQTLIGTGNSQWKLPVDICKLIQLRHLVSNTKGYLNVSTLTNLQTLKYVKLDQWVKIDSKNLINLRELEVREIYLSNTSYLNSFVQLKSLQTLTLHTNGVFPLLLALAHCQHLIKLKLDGKVDNLPNSDEFPPNITILILYGSILKQDPAPILEKLPNLTILDLGNDSYVGHEMFFTAKGFPQLQVLRLSWLRNLKRLEVQAGAMPRLKNFSIEDCSNLLIVPDRLRMLPLPQEW